MCVHRYHFGVLLWSAHQLVEVFACVCFEKHTETGSPKQETLRPRYGPFSFHGYQTVVI